MCDWEEWGPTVVAAFLDFPVVVAIYFTRGYALNVETPDETAYLDRLCIGRDREVEAFESQFLDRFLEFDADEPPMVVLLHGDGGIGKSTLLRKFLRLADQRFQGRTVRIVRLDWEDDRALKIAGGLSRNSGVKPYLDALAGALDGQNGWRSARRAYDGAVETLTNAYTAATQLTQDDRSAKDRPQGLDNLQAMALDAAAVLAGAAVTATSGPVGGLVAQSAVLSGGWVVSMLRSVTGRPNLTEEGLRALGQPVEFLVEGLGQALSDWSVSGPVIISLDTYELAHERDAVLRQIIRRGGRRVAWVIAGRRDLYHSQHAPEDGDLREGYHSGDPGAYSVLPFPVEPLPAELIREYFQAAAPRRPALSDEQVKIVESATWGIPLAVRMASQIWRETGDIEAILVEDGVAAEKIVDEMVDRYLRHCVKPEGDRLALFAVALADGDPARLKAMLLPDVDGDEKALEERRARLQAKYSAVRSSSRGFRLHDTPRDFFLQYLKQLSVSDDPQWLHEYNQRAAEALIAKIQEQAKHCDTLEELCDDDDYVARCEATAQHLFWSAPEKALRWIVPRYLEGLAYSPRLRQRLAKRAGWWRGVLDSRWKRLIGDLFEYEGALVADADVLERHSAALARADERLSWLKDDPILPKHEKERRSIRLWAEARVLMRAERLDEALDRLGRAYAEISGDSGPFRSRLAAQASSLNFLFWRRKEYEQAAAAAQIAVRAEPDNARYRRELGIDYSLMKRYEEAHRHYLKAVEMAPDDAANQRALGTTYGWMKRYEEALGHLLKAVEMAPDDAVNQRALGTTYVFLKRYEEALGHLLKAVEIGPDDAANQRALGTTYGWMKRYEEGLVHHLKAVEIGPDDDGNQRALGTTYLWMKRYEEALVHLLKAVEIAPDDAVAWSGLGVLHMFAGNAEAASSAFKESRQADDSRPNPFYLEGMMFYRCGDWPAAFARYAEAYSRDAGEPSAAFGLFALRRMTGSSDTPPNLGDLAALVGSSPRQEYFLALLRALEGDLGGALAALEEAIELTPADAVFARFEPALDALRGDPRFEAMTEDAPGSSWGSGAAGAGG